uniref:BZIP domain-containing protein n=1 Tax=Strongyloides stercoralis TaxID=6248 RepID=A0A0K0E0M8_STRER
MYNFNKIFSIIKKLPSFAVFFLIGFIYFSKTIPTNDKNLVKNSYNLKEVPVVLNDEVDDHVLKKRQRSAAARRRRRNRREINRIVGRINTQILQLQQQIQSLQQQLSSRVLLLTTTVLMP